LLFLILPPPSLTPLLLSLEIIFAEKRRRGDRQLWAVTAPPKLLISCNTVITGFYSLVNSSRLNKNRTKKEKKKKKRKKK